MVTVSHGIEAKKAKAKSYFSVKNILLNDLLAMHSSIRWSVASHRDFKCGQGKMHGLTTVQNV